MALDQKDGLRSIKKWPAISNNWSNRGETFFTQTGVRPCWDWFLYLRKTVNTSPA